MSKTSNGWTMQGMCFQWAYGKLESINELSVYMTILRHSFGFRKRWCYLKYSDFSISNSSSLKKVLDKLVNSNIITVKHTFKENGHRSKNEYKIIEPGSFIKNFYFDKDDKETEKYQIEEMPW